MRARATEAALEGRAWSAETAAAAADVLRGEGTPMDDHRASAAYRTAMLGNALPRLWAEREAVEVAAMSELSAAPRRAPSSARCCRTSRADLHVTGHALYTDDLVHRTRDVLHAHPVQAPHAHARVTAIRRDAALDVPGVVRVLTADDVPGVNDAGTKHDEPLFPDEVMFHGHAVCWVLGETLEAARLGAAAVEVDYEPLPAVVGVRDAIAQGSFQGGQPTVARGDVEAALAGAAHVVQRRDRDGRAGALLPRDPLLAGAWSTRPARCSSSRSTQHPSETQEIVAHVLGRASHEVTVQCLRMGGGFGGKEMQPHGFAAVAALGAVLTGRPVRVRLTRPAGHDDDRASGTASTPSGGRASTTTATCSRSTRRSPPTAAGASTSPSRCSPARCATSTTPTGSPHVRLHGRIARTHQTSQTAFRGFGGPQGMLVIEDVLGRCAPVLGIDPAELRRRNFYAEGQETPYGQPVRHADRLVAAWEQLATAARLDERRAEVASYNREHPHTKRGLAVTPVKFGISFNFTAFNQAGALVHVYKDGSVLVNHGGTEMGQGLHTKMLQVAATALGRAAGPGAAGADPHRQGAQHLRHRRQLGRRPQRRRGQGRLRADPRPARRGRRRPGPGVGGAGPRGLLRPGAAVGRGLLPHRGPALGRRADARPPLQVLRVRRRRGRGRGRRLHRGPPHCGGSTSCTTWATRSRRWSTSARSRAASCRAPAG